MIIDGHCSTFLSRNTPEISTAARVTDNVGFAEKLDLSGDDVGLSEKT